MSDRALPIDRFVVAIIWCALIEAAGLAAGLAPAPTAKPPRGYELVSQHESQEMPAEILSWKEKIRQLYFQGKKEKAIELQHRVLAWTEKTHGPEHPWTADTLTYLAYLYFSQGRNGEAEPLIRRALAIREKALGPDHPVTAVSLNDLAEVYRAQGRYGEAEPLHRRALAIREKALGPDHPVTAVSLNNLASVYSRQIDGLYSKSQPLFIRALAISEKALGADHPLTATILNNLADMYVRQGRYSEGEPFLRRALAIREKALGPDHPVTAVSLNNLGFMYFSHARYAVAEHLYKRAIASAEKRLGLDHPNTNAALNNLALLYLVEERYVEAENLLRRTIGSQIQFLQKQLPLLPVEQRQAQVAALGAAWEVVFSGAWRSSTAAELALFSRLNRQGLLLEIERRQGVLFRAPGLQQQKAQRLGQLTSRLSDPSLPAPQRQSLKKQRRELQRELYNELPFLQPLIVEPAQVAQALPEGSIFVAFQRYHPFDPRQPSYQRVGDPHYLALVLTKNGTTSAIELGPTDSIDPLIESALMLSRTPGTPSSAVTAAWKAVNSKVFPHALLPLLQGSSRLILSPDGELSNIPFLSVPSPLDPKRSLSDQFALQVVTNGRDLVSPSIQRSRQKVGLPLVMADPDFGPGGPWHRLAASGEEGRRVAKLLQAPPHLGPQASEATIKASGNAPPSVLHVASHGFFAEYSELKMNLGVYDAKKGEVVFGRTAILKLPFPPAGTRVGIGSAFSELPPRREDAMLNSAIILAGANRSIDNGYLYAKEVAQLQLDGTDLVVLSACETAAGDHRSGEGRYGLQRALRVAGARSTLLSLWKVDDAATAAFMERFYDKLINQNMGKREALLEVQREFRSGELNPAWKDWAYWAAWQLVGDTGPLQR